MAALNLIAPTSWGELSQDQLAFLLRTIETVNRANLGRRFRSAEDFSDQCSAQVATFCLFRWNGVAVVTPYSDAWLLAHDGEEFVVSAADIAAATRYLSWISELPQEPVRLDCIDGAKAVPADLDGDFSFDDWLACEALWQNYQVSQASETLAQMAALLYKSETISPAPWQLLGIFYWWAGVKALFNRLFPNFFQPSSGPAAEPNPDSVRRNMDAQIRALTKGDITKEELILSMPALRALTELDALAREYDELNRKYPSK